MKKKYWPTNRLPENRIFSVSNIAFFLDKNKIWYECLQNQILNFTTNKRAKAVVKILFKKRLFKE